MSKPDISEGLLKPEAIIIIHDLPVLDLEPAKSLLEPDGDWVHFRPMTKLQEDGYNLLVKLIPNDGNSYAVLIDRHCNQMCLARMPASQQKLSLVSGSRNAGNGNQNAQTNALNEPNDARGATKAGNGNAGQQSPSAPASKSAGTAASFRNPEGQGLAVGSSTHVNTDVEYAEAFAIAKRLKVLHESGDLFYVDQYLAAIAGSPHAGVIANVLSMAGQAETVLSGQSGNHLLGGGEAFPGTLPSEKSYLMKFKDFKNLNKGEVTASGSYLGAEVDDPIARDLLKNQDYKISTSASQDQLVFELGAVSECSIEAEVFCSVSMKDMKLTRLTLKKVTHTSPMPQTVQVAYEQLKLLGSPSV